MVDSNVVCFRFYNFKFIYPGYFKKMQLKLGGRSLLCPLLLRLNPIGVQAGQRGIGNPGLHRV